MATPTLRPETFNKLIERDQTGEAVVTASGLAAFLRAEVRKLRGAVAYRQAQKVRAMLRGESRMVAQWDRERKSYMQTYANMYERRKAVLLKMRADRLEMFAEKQNAAQIVADCQQDVNEMREGLNQLADLWDKVDSAQIFGGQS
jgi:hypothetical protein